jgi:hypothetical protein
MVFAGILRFEDDLETKLKCTMKVLLAYKWARCVSYRGNIFDFVYALIRFADDSISATLHLSRLREADDRLSPNETKRRLCHPVQTPT